jgi:hypothetical protein
VQALENLELRAQLGLPPRPGYGEDGGVLLTRLPADSPAHNILREGDVLLALDGIPIAPDGTVQLPCAPEGVRVGMRYLVQRAAIGSMLRCAAASIEPRRHRARVPRRCMPRGAGAGTASCKRHAEHPPQTAGTTSCATASASPST